jgi:hypothetical protein
MPNHYGKKYNAAIKSAAKQFGLHSYGKKGTGVGLTSSGYGSDRKQFGLKQNSYGKNSKHGLTSAYTKGQSPYSEKSFLDPRGR